MSQWSEGSEKSEFLLNVTHHLIQNLNIHVMLTFSLGRLRRKKYVSFEIIQDNNLL